MKSLGGVFMGVCEQRNYDIVSRVIHGDLSMREAAILLRKSYRQTKRIVSKVRRKGMIGIKHGNFGRAPVNKIPQSTKQAVLNLLEQKYFDFNLTHFREKLLSTENINVNREAIRQWAHEKKLVKKAHKTKKRPALHRTRHRLSRRGMLLQMDGSSHYWFGPKGPSCCLVGNIDDATSICEYGEFFPAEDTISVLTVLKRTVERVGIPEVLYVDKASWFTHTKRNALNWDSHLSHVERAMADLGSRVLFAPSAEAKGRIERMWNTFQDRLIPELRIRNIRRIPTGNYFLQNHFIPEFNQKWSVPAKDPQLVYRPVPVNINLDEIFCIREWRKVSRGETISYNGKHFLVQHDYNYSLRSLQIEFRTYLDGTTKSFHANKPVTIELFPETKKYGT